MPSCSGVRQPERRLSFLNRFLPDQAHDDPLASIVRNLVQLLNSRREYGSLLCRFGLADYLAELDGRTAVMTALREIQETIMLYEPRLRVLSLKCIGRDAALWLHIELEAMILHPQRPVECLLLMRFHPSTGAVEIPMPARPEPPAGRLPGRPRRSLFPVPPSVLSAAALAAQQGPEAVLREHPELGPLLVAAALAAQAGLLSPELAEPAAEAGREVLEAQPALAAGLALLGQAAQAGLISPPLVGPATLAAKLAIESNLDVAQSAAGAEVAALTGVWPSEEEDAVPTSAEAKVASEMVYFARAAADLGLLPPAVAVAVAQSPSLALSSVAELGQALAVASLVAEFGSPLPLAATAELDDGP